MNIETNIIWGKYSGALFKYILKHVKNYQDSEDLLQEVFIKVHKNLKSFRNENIQSWLYKITKNTIVDYYRKKDKFNYWELTDNISLEIEDGGVTNEVIECLTSMINNLPDKYRQALLLTEFGGLSQSEFAKSINISSSGAKSRVQRARKKIKNMFTDCCIYQADRWGNIIDYQRKQKECKYC